jgi:F0F1-type ATP synthase assembly protein I
MMDPREAAGAGRALIQVGGMGITLALGVILFTAAGNWLDQRLGTSPALLMVGCLVGGALSLYKAVRDAQRAFAADEREEKRRDG